VSWLDGSRERALARFWGLALAAFQRVAESRVARMSGGPGMATLVIEYRVDEYAGWKSMFDRDPMGRKVYGVIGRRIQRDAQDPNHLMLSLEFGSVQAARSFLAALRPVWEISGAKQAWILEEAESA
jgi:hypothetical protein